MSNYFHVLTRPELMIISLLYFIIVGTSTYYRALIIGIASSQTKDWADRIG